jgi:hypothetical protein
MSLRRRAGGFIYRCVKVPAAVPGRLHRRGDAGEAAEPCALLLRAGKFAAGLNCLRKTAKRRGNAPGKTATAKRTQGRPWKSRPGFLEPPAKDRWPAGTLERPNGA